MTTRAQDRPFPVYQRGEQRDAFLSAFRFGLRRLVDPATGSAFSESDIAQATTTATRWYAEADALDLIELDSQRRALWLADQSRPERASTKWLRDKWAKIFGDDFLPARGGTGVVEFACAPGAIFVGSTEIPDAGVAYGIHKKTKLRFQVFYTVVSVGSTCRVTMTGIDTGVSTNLAPGEEIILSQGPISVTGPGVVVERFTGGAPRETNAELLARVLARIRYKQGGMNNGQTRDLARKASTSVDDAFVYACALHAGTVVVAVTQKRGGVIGPGARVANVATLGDVTATLVAPAAPEVAAGAFTLVVPVVLQPATIRMFLPLARGKATGWKDEAPWPSPAAGTAATISALATQTAFTVTTTGAAPSVGSPSLMAWNTSTSRWERLRVVSVVPAGGSSYAVTLADAPAMTLSTSVVISPESERGDVIAAALGAYADSLGPGEVIDLQLDTRAHRALRFPLPAEERPSTMDAGLGNWVQEALGTGLAGGTYEIANGVPAVPADPTLGPSHVVLRHVGLYPPPS